MQVPCCTTSALGWRQADVSVPGLLRLRGGKEFGAISGQRREGSAYLSACHPPTMIFYKLNRNTYSNWNARDPPMTTPDSPAWPRGLLAW